MITKAKDLHRRLKAAIHRHEQKEIELNRQDLLDLSDMTLPELQREHYAVGYRLRDELYAPEGKELLQERQDTLLRKIKLMRRLK